MFLDCLLIVPMDRMREQWDAFDTSNLNEDTTRDLLRLCGFAPQEDSVAVPRTFEEFQEVCRNIVPPMEKEEMERMMKMFNNGSYMTRKSLQKYLTMGDKLSDEEMSEFFRMCPFDDKGEITIGELVEFLHSNE